MMLQSARPRISLLAGIGLVASTLLLAACGGSGSSDNGSVSTGNGGSSTETATVVAISTTSLPNAQVGAAYSATLAAKGGVAPYSWSVASGTLPAGLALNASSGVLSGTPSAAATESVAFAVKDSSSQAQTATVTLTLTVTPATLTSSTTALATGTVGTAYSFSLAASGGTGPYTWSLSSGTLPAGLTLGAAGVISGTPTAAVANDALGITVQDAATPPQSVSLSLSLSVVPPALAIATAALPNGYIGTPYADTLAATGGTGPYTWSVSSGTLPAGLTLNAATGVISGTPTTAVNAGPIGFTATDSGTPALTVSATLDLTIAAAVTVAIAPTHAEVTETQPLRLSATTTDGSAVQWSISPAGGAFSAATSASGGTVTLTSPTAPGPYVVAATSTSDHTRIGTITVTVTDLAGVYTYHNDLSRDGANTQEYALTPATVTATTFGKLFSCAADGAIYAQPLWVANLTVNGAQHNVVIVATEHDSVFAFDADSSPCVTLWQASLVDTAHGAASGETSVPYTLVGNAEGDIQPEIGVTGTPVIDPATQTLYVVSKSVDSTQTTQVQRLHALDVTTGLEKAGSPTTIAATAPGTYLSGGPTVTFDAHRELQRTGLVFANGLVYVSWSSHEDAAPFFGWTMSYSYGNGAFSQQAVLNDDPNDGYGGIWMGGGAPAVDASGNLYLLTGNGGFDATSNTAPNNDYGDSMLKLTPALAVAQYFTPSDQANDNSADRDFGSGGASILVDLPNCTTLCHLIVGGGKDGYLYSLNRDMLGGSGDANAWQQLAFGSGIFSTGAYWNNYFFIRGANAPLQQLTLNPATALFSTSAPLASSSSYGYLTNSPSVSAAGATSASTGIVWDLDTHLYCTHNAAGCGPAVLHAFNAVTLADLWNSGSTAGNAVKFTVPTVANGKVYIGTRGNNTGLAYGSTSVSGELDVYGLTN